MGFLDKVKSVVGKNADKAEQAIDKAADLADSQTKHQHSGQIDGAADKLKDVVEKLDDGK